MPAKFHPVAPAVWDRTMRELSGPATVVRLYVLTCPTRLSEGLFYLPVGHLQHDAGLAAEHVADGLAELIAAGLVSYDHAAEVVLDRTALRYSPPAGPKQIGGAIAKFGQVPDTPLRAELYRLAREHSQCGPEPHPVPEGYPKKAACCLASSLAHEFPALSATPTDTPSIPHRMGTDSESRAELGRAEVESGAADVRCPDCGLTDCWCDDPKPAAGDRPCAGCGCMECGALDSAGRCLHCTLSAPSVPP